MNRTLLQRVTVCTRVWVGVGSHLSWFPDSHPLGPAFFVLAHADDAAPLAAIHLGRFGASSRFHFKLRVELAAAPIVRWDVAKEGFPGD